MLDTLHEGHPGICKAKSLALLTSSEVMWSVSRTREDVFSGSITSVGVATPSVVAITRRLRGSVYGKNGCFHTDLRLA